MSEPTDSAWGWWRERRLPAELVHLDSAAAGRSSTATLAATAAHAEREVTRGAYVAQTEAAPVLDAGRAELARLLGVPAAGLAFTESAEAALNALLEAWPLRAGDPVAVVASETREALCDLPGWAVAGPGDSPSAITALRATNGQDVAAARARLLGEHGILTTAGAVTRAPREMTEPLLRISPHVDCTPEDLARLREALQAFR